MAMLQSEAARLETLERLVQTLMRLEHVPFIENIKRRVVDPEIEAALAALELGDISDVTLTTPSTGQVLEYASGVWVNATDNV